MLRTVVSEQQNDWDDHLPAALCAYRSTPHASTRVSPHKMVYGVEMTLPLDLMLGDTGPEQPEHECPYEYVEWIKDSLRRAHSRARKHSRLLPNISIVDMESQIGLFDLTAANGSGNTPDREANYAILTQDPG